MDLVLLPVVSRDSLPDAALKILKESRRSMAVVVGSPPQGLVKILDIRRVKNQHRETIAEVNLEPIAVLFDGEFATEGYFSLNLPESAVATVREHFSQTFPGMPHRQLTLDSKALGAFERLLPANAPHGFLGYDRGAAVVITRHETLAAEAGAPPLDCCCGNPTTPHEYPAGRKRSGQPCDICAFAVEC